MRQRLSRQNESDTLLPHVGMVHVPIDLSKLAPNFIGFGGRLKDDAKFFEGEVKDHLLGLPALVDEHAGGQEQIAHTDMDAQEVRVPRVTSALDAFVDSNDVLLPVANITPLGADLAEDGLRDRGVGFGSSSHSII